MADEPLQSAPKSCIDFNFCFWAKLIVAIPAIPLIGLLAASFFSSPFLQFFAAIAAMTGAFAAAIAIDRLPSLSGRINKRV